MHSYPPWRLTKVINPTTRLFSSMIKMKKKRGIPPAITMIYQKSVENKGLYPHEPASNFFNINSECRLSWIYKLGRLCMQWGAPNSWGMIAVHVCDVLLPCELSIKWVNSNATLTEYTRALHSCPFICLHPNRCFPLSNNEEIKHHNLRKYILFQCAFPVIYRQQRFP